MKNNWKGNQYRNDSYETGIIYCIEPQGTNRTHFLKYHGLSTDAQKRANFILFASKFHTAVYINFYKKNRQYVGRTFLPHAAELAKAFEDGNFILTDEQAKVAILYLSETK